MIVKRVTIIINNYWRKGERREKRDKEEKDREKNTR